MADGFIKMDKWPNIVKTFPRQLAEISRLYRKLPSAASDIFYHYTTHTGLEGILRSGGLRATHRMRMSDGAEFKYARDLVFDTLNEVGNRHDIAPVAQSLTLYIRKYLDNLFKDTTEMSSAYCACLTINPDQPGQWKTYAENGNGFAIGLNMRQFLNAQIPVAKRGDPFIYCCPVIYNEEDQRNLVERLVEAGIHVLTDRYIRQSKDFIAIRNWVTKEIVIQLLPFIDFFKATTYSSERELRLIMDPNNGTLKASNIQYNKRPFIFMNLCVPVTRRLPLAEIKVGPKASFAEKKKFLEDLLNELDYGNNFMDRPRITQSLVAIGSS